MDIHQIRKDSPSSSNHLFFDSAGSSLMPVSVVKAIKKYLDEETYWGGYKVMTDRMDEAGQFYKEAATLLNCEKENIAFANSATEAFAKALSSITFKKDDLILTTDSDYVSNYMLFISLIKREKIKVERINSLPNGDLDLDDLKSRIDIKVPRLVAITHMPTNSGLIQDAIAVGEICKQYDILYMLDACQSVGQIEVDTQAIQCDFMSVTGRKFLRGPRGTGLLFASNKVLNMGLAPLSIDAWSARWTKPLEYVPNSDATRFENFEKPYPMFHGFIEALSYLNNVGIKQIENRNKLISNRLRKNLASIAHIKILDQGTQLSNIVTFIKGSKDQSYCKKYLFENKVIHSMANRFSALIDFDKKGHEWAIRLSPHYFNTIEEIDEVSDIIDRM